MTMRITVDRRWRVDARQDVALPISAAAAWRRMKDVRRFLTFDPLHVEARFPDVPDNVLIPPPRARVILRHRLFGIGPDRIGRLLQWREGRGYAVSDLSKRGCRNGFPHICAFDVRPSGESHAQLTHRVRGLWTARWIPRPVVRLWLWWVMMETGLHLRRALR